MNYCRVSLHHIYRYRADIMLDIIIVVASIFKLIARANHYSVYLGGHVNVKNIVDSYLNSPFLRQKQHFWSFP